MESYIEKIFCEYPDVEVIQLKDGSYIGINDECICYYKKELFEDGVCITRDTNEIIHENN